MDLGFKGSPIRIYWLLNVVCLESRCELLWQEYWLERKAHA